MDISRIARGKIELQLRPVEIAVVLAKAIETASPLIESRSHRLITSIPESGLLVRGDEHRLTQVMANLITNAAKYSDPGGVIEVTATREQRLVAVSVRDSGIGISAELLPRIFERFVQGERALDRSEGGLGLGLTIVESLVELHDGSVCAQSAGIGKGSEFVVRLPFDGTGRAEPEAAQAGKAVEAAAASTRLVRRILVVDDNVDTTRLLAQALTARGHDVRVAFDANQAIEVVADFCADVALVDIGLPVLNGYQLAAKLRALPGLDALKLIAVTGYGDGGVDRRQGVFHQYLVKPLSIEVLEQMIDSLG
jgi:CheY-like chemotaxis protein/two-component sensor histidine kinase